MDDNKKLTVSEVWDTIPKKEKNELIEFINVMAYIKRKAKLSGIISKLNADQKNSFYYIVMYFLMKGDTNE